MNRCVWGVMPMLVLSILLGGLIGCSTARPNGPYAPMSESTRDPATSQRLSLEAAEIAITNPARAETMLREALTLDLYNGPAHNNLGAIYLTEGRLYEAAGEFEHARKLMPGHPDPRLNLALTLEKAGRTDEALTTYATALEVYPEHIPTMQALARLQLRSGRANDHTPKYLDEIALRGETEPWRAWARLQRAKTP